MPKERVTQITTDQFIDASIEVGKDVGAFFITGLVPAIVGGYVMNAVGNNESTTAINPVVSSDIAGLQKSNSDLWSAYYTSLSSSATGSKQAASFDLQQIHLNDFYISIDDNSLYNQIPFNPNPPALAGLGAIALTAGILALSIKRVKRRLFPHKPLRKARGKTGYRLGDALVAEDLPSDVPDPEFDAEIANFLNKRRDKPQ